MRKWSIIISILILLGVFGYNYLYQDHRDIQTEKSIYKVSSQNLIEEFQINSDDSESKYLDKTITVFGYISHVDVHSVVIDNVVFCQFEERLNPKLKESNNITIKGRFLGYDDLLEEIKLDQCHIIN
ncbi:OB-fold protein [Hanstruepera ponticola]|uniref:OB-fold protein n=1 Tax=Hanstruepera ponticola TaxID=2042995 RepID=UPI00177E7879|nr:hypothetical protein [Hanstruepera ponticola]